MAETSPSKKAHQVRAEKTMTATDVTGFDAIFSTGFFATFSRFLWGSRLTKLHINTGEKATNPVESLQWRRRPEIADFLSLVVVEIVLTFYSVQLWHGILYIGSRATCESAPLWG